MTVFLILSVLLVLLCLLVLAFPLLRTKQESDLDAREQNIILAKEAIAQLQQNLKDNFIDQESYDAALAEQEIRLADELATLQRSDSKDHSRYGLFAFVTVMLLVPLVSLVVYQQLGSPNLIDFEKPVTVASSAQGKGKPNLRNPDEIIQVLKQRIETEPNNVDAWYLLGRMYASQGDYARAVETYQHLREISSDHPSALVAEADAMAMLNDGKIAGEPYRLVRLALDTEPENTAALWMAGSAASEVQDYQNAIYYWRRAEAQMKDEPRMVEQLRALIANAVSAAQAAGLEAEDPGTSVFEAPSSRSVEIEVQLDQTLEDQLANGAILFVFAKQPDGPPMPVAAIRESAIDFPKKIVLKDENLLRPDAKLDEFDQLKLSARISMSGDPIPQPGDLQAGELILERGQQAVSLLIDQVVP